MIPSFKHSKLEIWLAFALGLITFVILIFAQADMGIPRDESVYFEAGERYMGWLDDWQESPVTALSKESISRHFQYNREHPALPKILFGLSHQVFTKWLGWTSHMLGARLPALVPRWALFWPRYRGQTQYLLSTSTTGSTLDRDARSLHME